MTVKEARIKLEHCEQRINEYELKVQQMQPSFLYDYEKVESAKNELEHEIMQRNALIDFIKGGGVDE